MNDDDFAEMMIAYRSVVKQNPGLPLSLWIAVWKHTTERMMGIALLDAAPAEGPL